MTPDSIRALATLLGVHLSARAAVIAWPPEVCTEDAAQVERISALVRLGVAMDEACVCVLAADGIELGDVLARGEVTGGRTDLSLLGLARRIEVRQASRRMSDATAIGAKLSARIVIGVPVGLGLLSLSRSNPTPMTLVISTIGIGLAVAGARWMSRLKPQPPRDEAEHLALSLADAVEGGITIHSALERLASEGCYRDVLGRAGEGSLWVEALLGSDVDEIRRIGRCCRAAERYGRPLAPALRRLAADESERRAAALDRAVRGAPVRMVLPLTICVLPGSLLIGAAPLVT